jgi:quinol monooxygenase YgiN
MAFIQVIEVVTIRIDEARALGEEWEQATEGKRTARRRILVRDRDNPNRYLAIVFFDSYESAMENSRLPETQAAAEKWAALADEPLAFRNLEVIEDR